MTFGAPAKAEDTVWRTGDEIAFIEGIGHWRLPSWVPSDAHSPAAYRRDCLAGYLSAFESRIARGSVNWTAVKARAVELFEIAQEKAA